MNKKRIAGFIFIFVAIAIIISNLSITGAVIGKAISNSLSLIAAIFLIVGIVLATYKGRNIAQEILDTGRYVDSTKYLKKVARKMGYELKEGYKEGTKVCDGDVVITIIPNHRKIRARGTSISILEALATGQSSFRRRGGELSV